MAKLRLRFGRDDQCEAIGANISSIWNQKTWELASSTVDRQRACYSCHGWKGECRQTAKPHSENYVHEKWAVRFS